MAVLCACGDTPAAPTNYPRVDGQYLGNVTLSYSGGTREVHLFTEVLQSKDGKTVTVFGRLTTVIFPNSPGKIQGELDAALRITAQGGFSWFVTDPSCGAIRPRTTSIRFEPRRAAHYTETAETEDCGEFDISGTLDEYRQLQ